MKTTFYLLSLLAVYLFFISATTIEKEENAKTVHTSNVSAFPIVGKSVQNLSFFQKISHRFFIRKNELASTTKADKLAVISLILGVSAFGFFFLSFGVPFLFAGAIPLAIAAFVTGNSAIRHGTSRKLIARIGKGLGIVGFILLVLFLILGIAYLSNWN